ncbi:MAG: tetraacyldisaccharide 4'-kinase [Gammaproteobacteria bacterium]|nr:tetraacyldisaccharide 4'-kinase [Gammaproteobacteria bacterium]MCP4088769.1 tetraacyldisaccharide 4'-kinase [Gammaproteobacteria bacterium]MCP4832148.1 tetraacyldisaccharide 4'-kinase [Gammaproteobacteria bacterium]MCP4928251.1 tetraacyldisaccharide 4'-kinase [Gammaproteobacteria bacterium]
MTMPVSQHKSIESLWYGNSTSKWLLLPLAWIYGLIVFFRRSLYTSGLLTRPQLPVPVIVVGNIAVGGTGKTPVVAWLAQQLHAAGYRPGIVSRGYGGSHSGAAVLVNEQSDAAIVGDEPLMLAQITACPVCICTDRVAAVEMIAQQGVNVVITDDGLQHYRLRRSFEIVVVDGQRGFGNGQLLPAGPLRENLQRIGQADAVLINGGSELIEGTEFNLISGDLHSVSGNQTKSLNDFHGQRVWGLAGIGNPGRFYSMLIDAGLEVDRVDVNDHGKHSLASLVALRDQPVLMTQKDAVKYHSSVPQNAWYLPVEVQFAEADATKLMQLIGDQLAEA